MKNKEPKTKRTLREASRQISSDMRDLYEAGHPVTEIAEFYGVTVQTVYWRLNGHQGRNEGKRRHGRSPKTKTLQAKVRHLRDDSRVTPTWKAIAEELGISPSYAHALYHRKS